MAVVEVRRCPSSRPAPGRTSGRASAGSPVRRPAGAAARRPRGSRRRPARRPPDAGWPSGSARAPAASTTASCSVVGAPTTWSSVATSSVSWSVPDAAGDTAARVDRLGGAPPDQLGRARPVQAHAALRGVHRLGDAEAVATTGAAGSAGWRPSRPPLVGRSPCAAGRRPRARRRTRLARLKAGHRRASASRHRSERVTGSRIDPRPCARTADPSSASCTPRAPASRSQLPRFVQHHVRGGTAPTAP